MMDLFKTMLATISFLAPQSPPAVAINSPKYTLASCSRVEILKTEKEIDVYLSNVQKSVDDLLGQLIFQLDQLKIQAERTTSRTVGECTKLSQSCIWLKEEVQPYLLNPSQRIKKSSEEIAVNKKALEHTEYAIEQICATLEKIMLRYHKALTKKLQTFTRQLNNTQELTPQEKESKMQNIQDLKSIIKRSAKLLLVPSKK